MRRVFWAMRCERVGQVSLLLLSFVVSREEVEGGM